MDRVRYGIIGTKNVVRGMHLPVLNNIEEAEIVALCDLDSQALQAAAQQVTNGKPRLVFDYRQLLNLPEIDAVLVATPNHLHADIVVDCFQAGKHVFCEKPLATNLRDCDRMIAAAQQAGKILQVGLVYRYSEFYRTFKQIVERQDIGPVHMMWCQEFRGFWGYWGDPWRLQQKYSGGSIVEKNCHHFDIFNWVIGAEPVKVAAFGGTNVHKESDAVDNAWVIVEYANGARAQLGLCLFSDYGNKLEIGAIGARGKLESWVEDMQIVVHGQDKPDKTVYQVTERIHYVDALGNKQRYPASVGHTGSLQQHREFIDCVRHCKPAFADGAVGRQSILIPLAAEKSIREGRIISIGELE